DRAVVLQEFEQYVERPRIAGQLERDLELVQRFPIAAQRAQPPGKVRARHDLVVRRTPRLKDAESLSYRADRPVGMTQKNLETFDVACHIPGRELVMRSLRNGAGALEKDKSFRRVGFHRYRIAWIER